MEAVGDWHYGYRKAAASDSQASWRGLSGHNSRRAENEENPPACARAGPLTRMRCDGFSIKTISLTVPPAANVGGDSFAAAAVPCHWSEAQQITVKSPSKPALQRSDAGSSIALPTIASTTVFFTPGIAALAFGAEYEQVRTHQQTRPRSATETYPQRV